MKTNTTLYLMSSENKQANNIMYSKIKYNYIDKNIFFDLNVLIEKLIDYIEDDDLYPITIKTTFHYDYTLKCFYETVYSNENKIILKIISDVNDERECFYIFNNKYIYFYLNVYKTSLRNTLYKILNEFIFNESNVTDYNEYHNASLKTDFLNIDISHLLPNDYKTIIECNNIFNETNVISDIKHYIELLYSSLDSRNQLYYSVTQNRDDGINYFINFIKYIIYNKLDSTDKYIDLLLKYLKNRHSNENKYVYF